MTSRQALFVKLVRQNEAWHAARKEKFECEAVQCPDCGVSGYNQKTGICNAPGCCGRW